MAVVNATTNGILHQSTPFTGNRYRWLVVAVYSLVATVTVGVAWLQMVQIDQNMANIARERGAVLFSLIGLTRDWNAGHGGVYVPITDATPPNPYLKEPKRDVVTTDGVRLTKINPAFMTRQIAEIAEKNDGVRIHITSLKPIRPANQADAWEAESLQQFERGVKDRIGFFGDIPRPEHRYMAPLLVKQPCMKCHAGQGYEVGQIRGGISITMPAGNLLAMARQQRMWTLWAAFATFLAVALLSHLALKHARRYYLGMTELAMKQDGIIADRTRELEERAVELEREVDERARSERKVTESEARYRAVIDSSQDGVVVLDGGSIILANERIADLLDIHVEDVLGHPFIDFVAEADRAWVAERHQRRLRGEVVPNSVRLRLKHSNSRQTRIADVLIKPLEEQQVKLGQFGQLGQWVVTIKDVTQQLRHERELQIAAAVFEHATEGVMVTDRDNHILRVNPAFTSITGYTPGEVIGQTPSTLKSGHHDAAFYAEMWRILDERGHWEGEIWNRHKSGSIYVEWLAISTVPDDADDAGKYVATFIDITKRKQAEELLRHKAHHDPLTDLPNRTLFDDRVAGALAAAQRYSREFALLAIDLDHFKEVNDTLGHNAGDELLIEAAHRLISCVRAVDTVARLGGDEFSILLSEVGDVAEAEQVARRALELLDASFRLKAGEVKITGSIGIALYPRDAGNAADLKRNADRALYAVKASGRNGFRFYSSGL